MRYGSVCSGIEAATCAWHPLGWQPQFFAEIDSFPSAVLQHHYPNVPNMGDFTTIGSEHAIDLLVGGTPCQSFSVAGLRGGLADERGNLALEFLRLADRLRPRWLVWENVPGVLSSNGGRDFGSILGGLVELGYGFAYRVLDAQYFGVPQRRRRVFVVGHLGDWRRAAAVLFERHSLSGHPAPRRQKGQRVAGCLSPGAHPGGFNGQDAYSDMLVTHSLRAEGFDASEDGTGRGTPIVPTRAWGIQANIIGRQEHNGGNGLGFSEEVAPTLTKMDQHGVVAMRMRDGCEGGGKGALLSPELSLTLATGNDQTIFQPVAHMTMAFAQNTRDELRFIGGDGQVVGALAAEPGMKQQNYMMQGMAVRRLTPKECERLQGFPDDYTAIPYKGKIAADGPRYRSLGNSMAVPVMSWLGERIQQIDSIPYLGQTTQPRNEQERQPRAQVSDAPSHDRQGS